MPPTEKFQDNVNLRIEIEGSWTVQEFADLLLDMNDAYRRINTLEFFESAIRNEDSNIQYSSDPYSPSIPSTREDHSFRNLFNGYTSTSFATSPEGRISNQMQAATLEDRFELLAKTAELYTGPVLLSSISYSSPGWIEVVASWNPLKVIADLIIECKRQNTEREKNSLAAKVQLQQQRTDLIKALLDKDIIKKSDPDTKRIVIEYILGPTQEITNKIARDTRIKTIDLKTIEPSPLLGKPADINTNVHPDDHITWKEDIF
jgi:hypothetical protein